MEEGIPASLYVFPITLRSMEGKRLLMRESGVYREEESAAHKYEGKGREIGGGNGGRGMEGRD